MTREEQALRLAVLDIARLQLVEEGVEVRPLTYREIEEICGVSHSTAQVLERRAINKLRRKVREIESCKSPKP